jgi:hypothetical protein
MGRFLALLVLTPPLAAACGGSEPPIEVLPLSALGAFEYREKMALGEDVTRWNGRRVRATGFMNPTTQARNLKTFLLVKDRASCCFGKRPQINHYVEVTLKDGLTADYTTDPVTVEGVFQVDDRWDGDWQLGLYWMGDAEVRK